MESLIQRKTSKNIRDLFEINQGQIVGRIKEIKDGIKVDIYNKDHFNNDKLFLNNEVESKAVKIDKEKYLLTQVGDIVIDSNTYEAVIVNESNKDLLITFNYFVLNNINEKIIDSNYFIAWFNNHPNALKQIHDGLQGTTVKKITRRLLNEIEVILPNINEQKRIGKLYQLYKKKHGLMLNEIKYENEIIKNLVRGSNYD